MSRQNLNLCLGVTKIKCREIISKISIFESYVAAQCRNRMKIFTRSVQKFENISIFDVPEETSLIVCASMMVIACYGERLTAYDFTGVVTREWVMSSPVRFVKILPGLPGSECMLVALEDGSVSKIFLDSSFPIQIQKINQDRFQLTDEMTIGKTHPTLCVKLAIIIFLISSKSLKSLYIWLTTINIETSSLY